MRARKLRRRYGHANASPVHLLTDWSYIACRKGKIDTSRIPASRSPSEVTCPRCMKAKPHEFRPVDLAYARVIGVGLHK